MIERLRFGVANWIRQALYQTGVFGLFHRWRNSDTLTVLMFHRVLPKNSEAYRHAEREYTFSLDGFSRCLDFVGKHYNVVDLASVVAAGEVRTKLPKRAVLITFDDGWRDTVLYAVPELEKRGFPAVVFIATEVLDLDSARWWQDALVELSKNEQHKQALAVELGHMHPETANLDELIALAASLESRRRDRLLNPHGADPLPEPQMLRRSEVIALDKRLLAVAAHGHTHTPLTRLIDFKGELDRSRTVIAEVGGWSSVMSLPHGKCNSAILACARDSGFNWIFSSTPELSRAGSLHDLPTLGRIQLSENEWTCSGDQISPSRLASFLFTRQIRSAA